MLYFNSEIFHSFNKYDKYFLFNKENLSVFEVDELCYTIIHFHTTPFTCDILTEHLLNYNKNEIQDALELLKHWDVITKVPLRQELSESDNFFQKSIDIGKHTINGLFICVSNDCNLRCKYCCADYGRYGQKPEIKLMSIHTAKKSIDFLISNLTPGCNKPDISFIGGEPLLNFEVIKFTINYLKSFKDINPKYSLNTNGTLLNDEMAEWFCTNDISVRFSIDGPEDIHNDNRIYPNGCGSHTDTLKGINIYSKYSKSGVSAQTSIPHAKRLEEAVKYLWEIGINDVCSNITSEIGLLDTKIFKMTEEDWNLYEIQLESLTKQIISDRIDNNYSPTISKAFNFIRSLVKREISKYICGYVNIVAISPDEKIYACQSLIGFKEYLIGDLDTGLDLRSIERLGKEYSIYLNKCNPCWARNICKSACIALQIQNNEILLEKEPSKFCDSSRKFLEFSIYMYNYILLNKPELLKEI